MAEKSGVRLRLTVTLPTMRVACDKCRHGTEPLDASTNKHTIEIGCNCPIPEPVLLLGFRGQSEPFKIPLDPVQT